MPSTFGQWLFAIVALLVGLTAGWVLRGRQGAPGARPSIVRGAPGAAATKTSDSPAETTLDPQRPEAAAAPVEAPADSVEAPSTAGEPAAAPATTPTEEDQQVPAAIPAPRAAADDADLPGTDEPTSSVPAAEAPSAPAAEATKAGTEAGTSEAEAPKAETKAGATGTEPMAEVTGTAPTEAEAVQSGPAGIDSTETRPTESAATEVEVAAAGAADDFRRIQGIGPKMAAALQNAGIRTYRQLADLDEAALREVIRAAGLRAAPSLATWPQQARVLAEAPAQADQALAAVGSSGDA
jgi:predicted flap endonuclease-1-like 5' DNA nuclease